MSDSPPFSRINTMSEDELLLCIGQETAENDAAVPQSLGSLIERGRQVMQKAEPMLKILLCDPEGPKPVLAALSDEALHAAVVALIAGTAGFAFTPVAITYITAVILRRGLNCYCAMPKPAMSAATPES
jgi:hypothetical protein